MIRQALSGLTLAAAVLLSSGCACKQWCMGNPMFNSARRCDSCGVGYGANYQSFGAFYQGAAPCPSCGNGANFAPAPSAYPPGAGYPPPLSGTSSYQQQQATTTNAQSPGALPPYDPNYRYSYPSR